MIKKVIYIDVEDDIFPDEITLSRDDFESLMTIRELIKKSLPTDPRNGKPFFGRKTQLREFVTMNLEDKVNEIHVAAPTLPNQ